MLHHKLVHTLSGASVLSTGLLAFSWSVWKENRRHSPITAQHTHTQTLSICATHTQTTPSITPTQIHFTDVNVHKQTYACECVHYLAFSWWAGGACWGPGGRAGARRGESETRPPWSECAACPRSPGEEGRRNPPQTHTRLPRSHCLEGKEVKEFRNLRHTVKQIHWSSSNDVKTYLNKKVSETQTHCCHYSWR